MDNASNNTTDGWDEGWGEGEGCMSVTKTELWGVDTRLQSLEKKLLRMENHFNLVAIAAIFSAMYIFFKFIL